MSEEVPKSEDNTGFYEKNKKWVNIILIILLLAILGIGGYYAYRKLSGNNSGTDADSSTKKDDDKTKSKDDDDKAKSKDDKPK